jgi:hypothetical protein
MNTMGLSIADEETAEVKPMGFMSFSIGYITK